MVVFIFFIQILIEHFIRNHGDPDQRPRSVASDLGLLCLFLLCPSTRTSNAYHRFLFKQAFETIFQNPFRLSFQKYQHSVKISHSNSMNPVQFDAFSGLIWIQTICTKIIATSK